MGVIFAHTQALSNAFWYDTFSTSYTEEVFILSLQMEQRLAKAVTARNFFLATCAVMNSALWCFFFCLDNANHSWPAQTFSDGCEFVSLFLAALSRRFGASFTLCRLLVHFFLEGFLVCSVNILSGAHAFGGDTFRNNVVFRCAVSAISAYPRGLIANTVVIAEQHRHGWLHGDRAGSRRSNLRWFCGGSRPQFRHRRSDKRAMWTGKRFAMFRAMA